MWEGEWRTTREAAVLWAGVWRPRVGSVGEPVGGERRDGEAAPREDQKGIGVCL